MRGQGCGRKRLSKLMKKLAKKIFDSRCVLEVAIKQTCYLHIHIHLYVDIVIECRNKYNIADLMTINLHGQHLKEGMTILKYHLAFGVVDLLKMEKFERERKRINEEFRLLPNLNDSIDILVDLLMNMVALRLRKLGYTSGCSAGDTVPYIICCEKAARHAGALREAKDKLEK
uniref:Uncharacterized protein n=1 Tax=Lactuca sativa TaxID=4236 RepID=A0A9R1VKH1_LACSA|nr:hypothetical protein LSAT_V11C500242640 [Lactuca sativa]